MHKIEIFLPLAGHKDAMDAYFTGLNTLYLNGLPTGTELPDGPMTEDELLQLGFDEAERKLAEWTFGGVEDYEVSRDTPYMEEFRDREGNVIGWEFEFDVSEVI